MKIGKFDNIALILILTFAGLQSELKGFYFLATAVRGRGFPPFPCPGFLKEDMGESMEQTKITAIVHHADSMDSGLDIVDGGVLDKFYAWRIGEVHYYFDELENIVKICNRTLEAIEKITREDAVKEINCLDKINNKV